MFPSAVMFISDKEGAKENNTENHVTLPNVTINPMVKVISSNTLNVL